MARVLVVFIDALGPEQLERMSSALAFAPERRALEGVLGYSSGALATLLTGAQPSAHGRMCLFSRGAEGEDLLRPLSILGLLPRFIHERGPVRRLAAKALAQLRGLTGYVALHRVPPSAFEWLDMPERDDLFLADHIGGQPTFLARARAEGLRVEAARWALAEGERFRELEARVAKGGADLVFAYAAGLDGALHAEGNGGPAELAAVRAITAHVDRLRRSLSAGGPVTTILVGDHGMADVDRVVDPRSVVDHLPTRCFVDSTFLRLWGTERELADARLRVERARWDATWLDLAALAARHAPVAGSPYGDAFVVLQEGAIFAPSFVGGVARGMHGYDLGSGSSRAAIATDAGLPADIASLTDVARLVNSELGLS